MEVVPFHKIVKLDSIGRREPSQRDSADKLEAWPGCAGRSQHNAAGRGQRAVRNAEVDLLLNVRLCRPQIEVLDVDLEVGCKRLEEDCSLGTDRTGLIPADRKTGQSHWRVGDGGDVAQRHAELVEFDMGRMGEALILKLDGEIREIHRIHTRNKWRRGLRCGLSGCGGGGNWPGRFQVSQQIDRAILENPDRNKPIGQCDGSDPSLSARQLQFAAGYAQVRQCDQPFAGGRVVDFELAEVNGRIGNIQD